MSRKTIHRIYTEDERRATIVRVISKQFESFPLQPTTGYYRGKQEKSLVLKSWARKNRRSNGWRRVFEK